MMRLLTLLLSLALAACGGGGSNGTNSSAPNLAPATPAALEANAVKITVEAGPGNNVNLPYVTLTICAPGTTTCQIIDHILVDTGSTGLRLLASALTGVNLPAQSSGASSAVWECAQFLNFVVWGPVKLSDITIGEKRAASMPMQLVETTGSGCNNAALSATSASELGANGILGVGLFTNDGQLYYNCAQPSRFCKINVATSSQVQNPVTRFATDNNGVLLQLPAVASSGATRIEGQMIFGVDTQSNNQLGTARVIQANSVGYFSTTYKGTVLPNSYIDSGSNGLYFDDPSLSQCSSNAGFYCPPSQQNLMATITLRNGASDTVPFSIANASTLFATNNYGFNNLGGGLSSSGFDWGLPFFLGRNVYTVIEGRSTSAGTGPLYAYTTLLP